MKKKEFYTIPDELYQRIHFVRPRFKGDIENVLLYMAKECCRIDECSCEEYKKKIIGALRMYPGNIDKTDKTLQNWRTEIAALFGLYIENDDADTTRTSQMAFFLSSHQDLTQFMRIFLYTFQFPGGHLKANEVCDLIHSGIRFKPAQLILQVLQAGNVLLSEKGDDVKEMSISAEEATYCIFNDLRSTTGMWKPKDIASLILKNRKKKFCYYNKADRKIYSSQGKPMTKGDVTRYAGDILDYMVIANLLTESHGYYYMKGNETIAISQFVKGKDYFKGYEQFYGQRRILTSEVGAVEQAWFEYVNDNMKPELFKTDIRTFFEPEDEITVVINNRIDSVINDDNKTTKDIGDLGESIIYGHEKMRVKIAGYEDFISRIKIVDSASYHPGYDIESYEADGTNNHRYIEVKTTISKQKILLLGFHMSTNEWDVAETLENHYYVYRLMLSEKSKILYVLRNPTQLYRDRKINCSPRNGMEVSFEKDMFGETKLLQWKN